MISTILLIIIWFKCGWMILIKTSEGNIIAEYVCNHDITMYQITVDSILSCHIACFIGIIGIVLKEKNKEKNK